MTGVCTSSEGDWGTYLEGVLQPVDGGRVERADHLQDAVEVVQLLEDGHHLEDARDDRDALLKVLRLQDALLQPEGELQARVIAVRILAARMSRAARSPNG